MPGQPWQQHQATGGLVDKNQEDGGFLSQVCSLAAVDCLPRGAAALPQEVASRAPLWHASALLQLLTVEIVWRQV